MADVHVAILAAGKGRRMKSCLPKVLHRVAGTPMIDRVLATARSLDPIATVVVIGHEAETLKAALAERTGLSIVVQEPQLGTAHALLATESALAAASGTLVMLSGDVPLLSPKTLYGLIHHHRATTAAATILTAFVQNPHGYGRIVRSGGQIARIVEEKDASNAEREIREINSGIYAFDLAGLFEAIRTIAAENSQGEHYLPDLVAVYRRRGRVVETVGVLNVDEIRGVNCRAELAEVSRILWHQKQADLMAGGVTIEDTATAYIGPNVQIGVDTIIHPGVTLDGATTIGNGCDIHSGVRIVNSTIADAVTILDHSLITDSTIASHARIGPFAHLRNHVEVRDGARIGNFVELKNTRLGAGSKAMHLTYLGDAVIGEHVNIGAGTITCNYDGKQKNRTKIDDNAFIGSDTQLVAPITIGKGAYVGSGTTVREDVPPGSLAVSAGKQRNIEGWVERKKETGNPE